jgi:hypothetical protein
MKKALLILPILLFSLPITIGLILLATHLSNKPKPEVMLVQVQSRNLVKSPVDQYHAAAQTKIDVLASVGKEDSRPIIIDNFLSRHKSPMVGLGQTFVDAADRYGLDYRLLPAIAFQESTLGKRMPKGSHNAWGWAVYTGETSGAKFKSWEQAINTVAQGLKADYIDRGLASTEAIMTRYSVSEGDWAFGVNFAIEEMTPK